MARDFLYCETTDTKLYANDIVIISSYVDVKWIVKHGWYTQGTAQKNGWYFVSILDQSILPVELVNLADVTKDSEQAYHSTLKGVDTPRVENTFIIIPGTNIRLYDGDAVKIANYPRVKWVVHLGWYIYGDTQNYGWYFVSVIDGSILPVSVIDLTLVTLTTLKTQGSGNYDGKVVKFTRPFTLADAEVLNRTFLTLETTKQRDNLDRSMLVHGRLVRVNDVGGIAAYYAWNATTSEWDIVDFGGGSSGIPELIGTAANPIVLSELPEGLYRIKGTYKISPNYETIILTPIDHIAFILGQEFGVQVKVITDASITDYTVENEDVTLYTEYATRKYISDNYYNMAYIDNKLAAIERQISEMLIQFRAKVLEIVNERLEEALDRVNEQYINNLFND